MHDTSGGSSFVRLDKADFTFAAAHFCLFPDGREPLHGHNYRVYVELHGPVDNLGYVAEFGWLKTIIRETIAKLDHRVLIAEECPDLDLQEQSGQIEVSWGQDHWSFPRNDVVRLPVKNTTAELLAGYLWTKLCGILGSSPPWDRLTVEVEETPGQSAGISRTLREGV